MGLADRLRAGAWRHAVDQKNVGLGIGERENLYVRAVRLFTEAVRGEGQPSASGEDGIRSLAIGLAVQESVRSGRQVQVTG